MMIDTTGWTVEQIRDAIRALHQALEQAVAAAQDEDAQNRDEAGAAIADLETLLGPEDAAPGIDSIRAVAAFDDATISEHQALLNRLILQALELNVSTQIVLAKIAHAKA